MPLVVVFASHIQSFDVLNHRPGTITQAICCSGVCTNPPCAAAEIGQHLFIGCGHARRVTISLLSLVLSLPENLEAAGFRSGLFSFAIQAPSPIQIRTTEPADVELKLAVASSLQETGVLLRVVANDAPTATNLSAPETYTEDTALNLRSWSNPF